MFYKGILGMSSDGVEGVGPEIRVSDNHVMSHLLQFPGMCG